jgi:hypothetical protein
VPKYRNYAWIIEKDYTEGLGDHEPRFNETTKQFEHSVPKSFEASDVEGPRDAHPDALRDLRAGKGQAFQLWDDDGILYYRGRWFEQVDEHGRPVETSHAPYGDPLADYGTPNAGATSMTVGNNQPYI